MSSLTSETIKKIDSLPPIREIIKKHEIFTKKSLGQHFLFDLNITDKIVRHAGKLKGYNIIEVGPGPAPLTRSILRNGAEKLILIEKDERLKNLLSEIKTIFPDELQIIFDDALQVNEGSLVSAPRKIIANLPYNVATPLILKWLDNINLFESITIMIQKEVAERLYAKPSSKAYGRLSVVAQFVAEVRHEFDVPPSAFIPPPKVTSTVITITPRKEPIANVNKKTLEAICKAAFGQRRKMLKKSLAQISSAPEELLKKSDIDGTRRPEDLSVQEFCDLARAFDKA